MERLPRKPIEKASPAELIVGGAPGDARGYVEGYASTFGNIDLQGDRVKPGAFAKTIRERVAAGRVILMIRHMGHGGSTKEAIGIVTQAREDARGLWIHAEFSSVASAQDARKQCAEGIVKYFSIGGEEINGNDVVEKGVSVHELTEVKLDEVTITPFPANEQAEITVVKSTDGQRAAENTSAPSATDAALLERTQGIARAKLALEYELAQLL